MTTESSKLPEGWHLTANYGEVFISPGGSAWTVQSANNQLKSIQVNISPSDIINTTAIDRVKHAQQMRGYRKSKLSITSTSNFTPQVITDA
jgi:hypothetical protein